MHDLLAGERVEQFFFFKPIEKAMGNHTGKEDAEFTSDYGIITVKMCFIQFARLPVIQRD